MEALEAAAQGLHKMTISRRPEKQRQDVLNELRFRMASLSEQAVVIVSCIHILSG